MVDLYTPATPLPPDIPADSQDEFLTNFQSLNFQYGVDHYPFGNSIEHATRQAPCRITSTRHGLTTGDQITVTHVKGRFPGQSRQDWEISGQNFTVTVIDRDNFTLDGTDTTGEPEYVDNTGDFTLLGTGLPYGLHKKITFVKPRSSNPHHPSPKSTVYTYNVDGTPELFFINDITTASRVLLTNLILNKDESYIHTKNGRGIKTPWGLIINFGQVYTTGDAYPYPMPYTSEVYALFYTFCFPKNFSQFSVSNINQPSFSLTQFKPEATFPGPGGSGIEPLTYYLAIGV